MHSIISMADWPQRHAAISDHMLLREPLSTDRLCAGPARLLRPHLPHRCGGLIWR